MIMENNSQVIVHLNTHTKVELQANGHQTGDTMFKLSVSTVSHPQQNTLYLLTHTHRRQAIMSGGSVLA